MHTIVLVSRQKKGNGGIQRYQSDLFRALTSLDQFEVKEVSPWKAFSTVSHLQSTDFVHCTDFTLALLAFVLRVRTKASVSITACGLDVVWHPWWYQLIIKFVAPRMKDIVAISAATADQLQERGVDHEKISIIPCGIFPNETHVYQHKNSMPMLLTVGRLVQRKGVEWFLEAVLPELLKKYPSLQYYIVGDGKRRKHIQRMIESKGLVSNVQLLTNADDRERDMLIQQAHLFVMPNITIPSNPEGFGIVCIESSIRGLPVAASKLEGIQDAVLHEKTGMFFEPENAQSAINIISELLEQPLDPQSVAEETRNRYDWNLLARMYAEQVFSH